MKPEETEITIEKPFAKDKYYLLLTREKPNTNSVHQYKAYWYPRELRTDKDVIEQEISKIQDKDFEWNNKHREVYMRRETETMVISFLLPV